ncbi:MAG: GNAT family N-acetyltransferase [Phenylobacterium sp.]
MIRHANVGDHPAIDEVLRGAFGRGDEAELTVRLRTAQDSLFELVAVEEGVVVGHILMSRLWADREGLYAALAPLSVRPDRQRSGLGSALVRAGLDSARDFGCHGVLVLGDPAYYGRFGFSAEDARGVAGPFAGLPAFQALALEEFAFARPLTTAYPDAFEL